VEIDDVIAKLAQIEREVVHTITQDSLAAPAETIRRSLVDARARGPDIETRCSVPDPSLQRVFVALCSRYGIDVFRRPRQRDTGLTVRAPQAFVRGVFSPLFQKMSLVIDAWHVERTEAMLRVFGAPVPDEPEDS
jgi:hypothetical protein